MKIALAIPLVAACSISTAQTSPWEKEVVYQIFPRSYYSARNNHVGDLKGITQKLDYLHDLGVTAILINPIFDSRLYHNYFADNFLKVDPTLGTNNDFFELVRQAHRRQMKVILDMEVQYVADHHPWYVGAAKDPKSPFIDYLWREGSAFYGQKIPWYGGQKVDIASINPDNPVVKKTILDVFHYWAAPESNSNLGVDGFRIDHMMDDLDNKHVKTGMLRNFWLPIERSIRTNQPNLLFLAEQADWGLGKEMFQKADVDAAYAIPLRFAFMTFNKQKIEKAFRDTNAATPLGKTQFVFIENHDLERYANAVKSDPILLRLGAVFNLTVKGTPLIYYGQELGMLGKQGKWNSDGNDIPIRLAYRWTHKVDSKDAADFYRNTGPWTKTGASRDDDGISVDEEAGRQDSLLNFYKRLICLRAKNPALQSGSMEIVDTKNANALCFDRLLGTQRIRVVLNLSNSVQSIAIPANSSEPVNLLTGKRNHGRSISLMPHGFELLDFRR